MSPTGVSPLNKRKINKPLIIRREGPIGPHFEEGEVSILESQFSSHKVLDSYAVSTDDLVGLHVRTRALDDISMHTHKSCSHRKGWQLSF
jgi:hypothetical protein